MSGMTYEEIGKELGVTSVRARAICENALRKIRKDKRAMKALRELMQAKQEMRRDCGR